MPKRFTIVEARRGLGRLAEDVRRTGQPVVLTRRGRPIARITPEPAVVSARGRSADAFAELRGTVRLNCDLAGLQSGVRELRAELANALDRREAITKPRAKRRRA